MASSETFPVVDAQRELNPGMNWDFQVDAAANEIKKHKTDAARKEQERKENTLRGFKTAIVVSAVIIAVAGAAFAISRKLREK